MFHHFLKNITARYDDKRWIPKNGPSRSSKATEERAYEPMQKSVDGVGHRNSNGLGFTEELKNGPLQTIKKNVVVASKIPAQVTMVCLSFLHMFYFLTSLF